jgi:sulfite reductase (ferredoxin)
LAIIALFNGQTLEGYNIALGGGLGMTHNKPETYPYIAKPIVFVLREQLVDAVKAVIKMQRDHGDRTNRKHARLKYLVAEKGVEWIKAAVEEQFGAPLSPARPVAKYTVIDHMGWHEQGDGLLYLGLPISSGRIQDTETQKIRTGLREVVQKYGVDPILTPNQDIILSNIKPADKAAIEALLRAHNLTFASDISVVSRWAMACPALPTCGLALTEAERVKEPMVAQIEAEMQKFNLENERISIRITGCPNGCARPYAGEIGLVGRQPGFYALYLGGDFEGTRLNERILDKVPEANIASTLGKAFQLYKNQQHEQETFGDFCHRLGAEALKTALEAA